MCVGSINRIKRQYILTSSFLCVDFGMPEKLESIRLIGKRISVFLDFLEPQGLLKFDLVQCFRYFTG